LVEVVAVTAMRMIAAMAVIIPKVNTHPSLFPRMDDTMIAGSPAKKAPKHNVRISRSDM
jgi:hypothetical protein